MMSSGLAYEHYDAHAARSEARDTIVDLFEATHEQSDPFYSTPRFLERFEGHSSRDGFELVLAVADETPAGLTYGFTLPARTRWWEGLRTSATQEFIDETGERTLALSELMVRPEWRQQGIARRLHDELLAGRHEQRATLLVRPDNEPARAAYAAWGWTKVGEVQPFADSPVFDALMISLRPE